MKVNGWVLALATVAATSLGFGALLLGGTVAIDDAGFRVEGSQHGLVHR